MQGLLNTKNLIAPHRHNTNAENVADKAMIDKNIFAGEVLVVRLATVMIVRLAFVMVVWLSIFMVVWLSIGGAEHRTVRKGYLIPTHSSPKVGLQLNEKGSSAHPSLCITIYCKSSPPRNAAPLSRRLSPVYL